MKKTFILLGIFLVMIIPIVIASTDPEECAEETNGCGRITEGGNLLIMGVEVQIDGDTSRRFEYGDDIGIKAKPNSEVIFEVKVWNNHTSSHIDEVNMNIEIDYIFEDEDSKDTNEDTTIKDEEYETFELTFELPSDTEEGDYDVVITVIGENSTNKEHSVEYELVLVVEFDEDEDYTSDEKTTLDELKTAIDELTTNTNYYDVYTECTGSLKTCEATITTRDNTITTLNDYKTKSENCNNEKTILNTQITTLQIANKDLAINNTAMQGNITNVKNTRVYWIIGILVLGGYLFYRYKERLFPKSKVGSTEVTR